jgi:hypothetical protein
MQRCIPRFFLLLRVLMRYFAVAIRVLAMALGGVGVLLRLFVVAVVVVVGRLVVVMRRRRMFRRGAVMMLTGGVPLFLGHEILLLKERSTRRFGATRPSNFAMRFVVSLK